MTIKQGSIDQLCGLYSVLNATELLIGKYAPYDRRLRVSSQKKALFGELVAYLARNDLLEEALTVGIEDLYNRGGLIDIAIKSVKQYQGLKMKKQRAFTKSPKTLAEYWTTLAEHLRHDGSTVIICFSCRYFGHWTCVKAITPKELILVDSARMKRLYRNQCTIGPEEKNTYTLWPSLTYLLSIEHREADE
ncbi:MAG: hypothetical protein MRK00_11255 [Nitrosomonas sp.]|nr:hypothetical protein [Nitrosomonas sp.]